MIERMIIGRIDQATPIKASSQVRAISFKFRSRDAEDSSSRADPECP